ncbi:MAG: ATP-binding protein [Armatimonadota bacterium]
MIPFAPMPESTGPTYIEEVRADRDVGRQHFSARVATYASPTSAPMIVDVTGVDEGGFIQAMLTAVDAAVRDAGGGAPSCVLKEVIDNTIHADFEEVVVSVMGGGSVIRLSDQGPGIPDKRKALLTGFTTATGRSKRFIRGVGSGLPFARDYLERIGGSLSIEDNMGSGTVVTIRLQGPDAYPLVAAQDRLDVTEEPVVFPNLTLRQKKVLSLVLEFGEAGPSLVSKELSVGLSTAYRDLAFLEESGLILADENGKRVMTDSGVAYLDALFD